MVNLWLQDIRATRDEHIESLRRLRTEARVDRLVELNVMRQVIPLWGGQLTTWKGCG